MSIIVRPYQRKDFDRVRLICIATADVRAHNEVRRQFILKTYCDYYLEVEPGNCFVAADVNDETGDETVIGYVLCAENCELYAQKFIGTYVPKIKELGKFNALTARSEAIVYGRHAAFFPAHLHIDILPDYQHQGIGTRLMDALTEHLREKKVKGVMLIVGRKNTKGINFYKKYGFSDLGKLGTGVAYGLDL